MSRFHRWWKAASSCRAAAWKGTRFVALALCLSCVACQSPPAPLAPSGHEPADIEHLVLISTNDLHGNLDSLPVLAGYLQNIRARLRQEWQGYLLLVDAGDLFQGTLESNLSEGRSVIEAYNAIGYDVATIGNHEFDYGPVGPSRATDDGDAQGALKAAIAEAKFPFVSSNLVDAHTKQPLTWRNLHASILLRVGTLNVGVIGALTAEASEVIKHSLFRGLAVKPAGETIVNEAHELRKRGANLVVGLVHAGADCKRFDDPHDLSSCNLQQESFQLLSSLPAGTLDVFFGGHRHDGVAHFYRGVAYAQAYGGGRAFSRIDVFADRRTEKILRLQIHRPEMLCESESGTTNPCATARYEGQPVHPDRELTSLVTRFMAQTQELDQKSLGLKVQQLLRRSNHESALGNLIVDLMRDGTPQATIAISNAGTLRADLPAGVLTHGALYRVMPFDNDLVLLQLEGRDLRRWLAAHLTNPSFGVLAISGLRVKARCSAGKVVVVMEKPDGNPVADTETLTVATSDFVAQGGDGIFPAPGAAGAPSFTNSGRTVWDALVAALEMRRTTAPLIKADDFYDPSEPRIDLNAQQLATCKATAGSAHQ
jgi:5'-nucleotidase